LQCRDVILATIAGGRTAADKDAEPKITAK
jgi:hypothetical protein